MDALENILLSSAFLVPLLLSITLLVDSRGNLPKKVMGWGLLNAFYVFFANYFYFRHNLNVYIALHSLHIASVLWLFPTVFLYVKSIVLPEKEFKKQSYHLLPGLLFGILSALLFYGLLNQEERIYYLSSYRNNIELSNFKLKLVYYFRMADVVLIVAQVVYYSYAMITIPAKYEKQLQEEYSNIEAFSIQWVKWFNLAFVFVGLLAILFYVFNPTNSENDLFLVVFLFTISVFMWILGIWCFKQQKPALPKLSLANEVRKSENLQQDELIKKLLHYFETDKPYLNSNLTLSNVCKHIGTNRTYLSNAINSGFGVNFNAFVNQHRVQFIKAYAAQNPQASNDEMVLKGGFGSVSSYKRAMANFG